MAAEYKIKIDQGSDVVIPIVLKDPEGTVLDLTGYTARMQIRPYFASSRVIDELTTENGRCEIDAANGKITLRFPHANTEKYPPSILRYDIEMESSFGEVTRILEGRFVVRPEVTR